MSIRAGRKPVRAGRSTLRNRPSWNTEVVSYNHLADERADGAPRQVGRSPRGGAAAAGGRHEPAGGSTGQRGTAGGRAGAS